jgi:hypothetical protein
MKELTNNLQIYYITNSHNYSIRMFSNCNWLWCYSNYEPYEDY